MLRRTGIDMFDVNKDGLIDGEELGVASDMLELHLREEKANTQRKMAWSSLISMTIFTIILFTPLISDARVDALAELLGLFYIAQAGIVGAFMGVQAWLSNSGVSSSRRYSVAMERASARSRDPDDVPAGYEK